MNHKPPDRFIKFNKFNTLKTAKTVTASLSSPETPTSSGKILFSVVIPTYNRAELLSGALEAVANQTIDFNQYEIIIVDDGSLDWTSKVVREFQLVYSKIGRASCRERV